MTFHKKNKDSAKKVIARWKSIINNPNELFAQHADADEKDFMQCLPYMIVYVLAELIKEEEKNKSISGIFLCENFLNFPYQHQDQQGILKDLLKDVHYYTLFSELITHCDANSLYQLMKRWNGTSADRFVPFLNLLEFRYNLAQVLKNEQTITLEELMGEAASPLKNFISHPDFFAPVLTSPSEKIAKEIYNVALALVKGKYFEECHHFLNKLQFVCNSYCTFGSRLSEKQWANLAKAFTDGLHHTMTLQVSDTLKHELLSQAIDGIIKLGLFSNLPMQGAQTLLNITECLIEAHDIDNIKKLSSDLSRLSAQQKETLAKKSIEQFKKDKNPLVLQYVTNKRWLRAACIIEENNEDLINALFLFKDPMNTYPPSELSALSLQLIEAIRGKIFTESNPNKENPLKKYNPLLSQLNICIAFVSPNAKDRLSEPVKELIAYVENKYSEQKTNVLYDGLHAQFSHFKQKVCFHFSPPSSPMAQQALPRTPSSASRQPLAATSPIYYPPSSPETLLSGNRSSNNRPVYTPPTPVFSR